MKNFLERGNIFRIEKGMKICTKIPAKYTFNDRSNSTEHHQTTFVVGEILSSTASQKTKDIIWLRDDIMKAFKKHGLKASESQVNAFLDTFKINIANEQFNTSIFAGDYVVTQAKCTGESKKIWKVVAKKLRNGAYNPDGVEILFYQNGNFFAKIPPRHITLIGDMLS